MMVYRHEQWIKRKNSLYYILSILHIQVYKARTQARTMPWDARCMPSFCTTRCPVAAAGWGCAARYRFPELLDVQYKYMSISKLGAHNISRFIFAYIWFQGKKDLHEQKLFSKQEHTISFIQSDLAVDVDVPSIGEHPRSLPGIHCWKDYSWDHICNSRTFLQAMPANMYCVLEKCNM